MIGTSRHGVQEGGMREGPADPKVGPSSLWVHAPEDRRRQGRLVDLDSSRAKRTRIVTILAAALVASTTPAPAQARSDFHDLPVEAAVESALAKERLLDVPYYLAGQKHPAVSLDLGEFKSNQRSNGFGKSDQAACNVAFLSALITLQKRVTREGASAVVDIKSVTRDRPLASETEYRCVAGNVVVNVALTGRVVKFK